MKLTIIAILLSLSTSLHAESEDVVNLHKAAHFFGGYTVNTGAYGIWKAIVNPEDRNAAIILGVLTTGLICAAKEASDLGNGGTFSARDMAYCGMGIGASTITVVTFKF